MRLQKIKLAGFKSFVEPTILTFPTNLTAIVGPNGCGKSNILDAVRWVTGEISAKQLRGETMSDVIFNGTENRKSLGQAATELIFDNSSGALGGAYAAYNEIVLRREVTRDGISSYYLNGAHCRRKDIVDIFLGTGLGSQSYAIIEQGMISQLIEAKPDDLRAQFEEAAGISRYKERRRETENRIEHTKENLARLNDIRVEIENQLKLLKKQAGAAEHYQKLRNLERGTKGKLQAFYWQNLNQQLKELTETVKNAELNYEAKMAKIRELEARFETISQEKNSTLDIFQETQNRFYALASQITQLEQQLHYNKTRQKEAQDTLQKIATERSEINQHRETDAAQLNLLQEELSKAIKAKEEAERLLSDATSKLQNQENAYQNWQEKWDNFNLSAAQIAQNFEVAKTRLHYLQQTITAQEQNSAKLAAELTASNHEELASVITMQEKSSQALKEELLALEKVLQENQKSALETRTEIDALGKKLETSKAELQNLYAKQNALKVLQENALGLNDDATKNWLTTKNLHTNSRLAQNLNVTSGWENAVEMVLNNYLEAICVNSLDEVVSLFAPNDLPKHPLTFIAKAEITAKKSNDAIALPLLLEKIAAPLPIAPLLLNIYAAETFSDALNISEKLAAHESIITKDGAWLGKNWVKINQEERQTSGVLQREAELKELQSSIDAHKPQLLDDEKALAALKAKLTQLENEREEFTKTRQQTIQRQHTIENELSVQKAKLTHLKEHEFKLKQELANQKALLAQSNSELNKVNEYLNSIAAEKAKHDAAKSVLEKEREEARLALESARSNCAQQKEQFDALNTKQEIIQKELSYLQQNLERAKKQFANLEVRRESAENTIKELETPLASFASELEAALQRRLTLEKELGAARQVVDESEQKVRDNEKTRAIKQEEVRQIRDRLEKVRLEEQSLTLKCQNHVEQINELGLNIENLIENILASDEPFSEETLQEKLARIAKRIENLGAINLTAIDEYQKQKQRKDYLDAQNDDLMKALTTLEGAIRQIDQETKEKFRQTFEQTNQNFQELFPQIFGGGHASLKLTEDDLLNAGVLIYAQPPGKRNSTIHLLSGGEKALTTIALIFALFKLNPAPFCLLDEVDAPLDDENVTRLCNLVKEMSKTVQFIFISHNKLTMEMANQLLGVTMQEAGISRIVSVDIKEALEMAKS